MKQGSIKNQMLAWMLALAIIPLIVVSAFSYFQANKSLTQAAEEKLEDTAVEKVKFIKNWFDYRFMDMQKQAENSSNAAFLQTLIEGYKKSGMELSDYVGSYDWVERTTKGQQHLTDLILSYDYIYDLFLIDNEGNILFSIALENDLGTNLTSGVQSHTLFSKSFQRTTATGITSFSDFERYEPSNGVICGFLTAPLIDSDGNSVGVFGLQFRIDRIVKLLDGEGLSHIKHYLVGADGSLRTKFSTDESEVLRRKIETRQFQLWEQEHLLEKGQPDSIYEGQQDEEALSYLNPDNVPVIGLHQSINVSNVQWALISEVEESLALAPVNYLARLMILMLIVTFIAVAVFSQMLSKRFSDPITTLSKLSEEAAKGATEKRADITLNNELGVLADSFNRMLEARNIYELRLEENNLTINNTLKDLEENANQLELVIDSTGVGIWDFQIQSGEAEFNERWADIVGYTLDELKPLSMNTWIELLHPEDRIGADEALKKHWKGESTQYVFESRMKHKLGHWVWVLDTGKVVERTENGKAKRMIGTHIDITKRKLAEAELIKAKEVAETAAQTKSEFLASMSHEIRTPMNGVLGMLGLISRSPLNEDQRHQTKLAISSAESLLSIINDILDFSKVEAGKLDLEILDFNLTSMLGDFAETMAQKVQESGLEFILDVTDVNHSMVKGDPSRIRQVLTNLVGNSLKFTSDGEVMVTAKLTDEGYSKTRLSCSIQDTGIGIEDEKIDHIFESFRQVDASTTRKYGGTGLGLSIVKQLCELMGGSIAVTSVVGEGSCFTFDVLLEKSSRSQKLVPNVDINGLEILIVDDNSTNLTVLRRQLELWGAVVTEAVSAKTALKLLDSNIDKGVGCPFKVAFLDMQMPEMDGATLAQEIQKRSELSSMKMVMMTSISSRGDAAYFAELGFSAYFRKPTTTSDLFDALAVVICGGDILEQAQPLVTHHYLRGLDHSELAMNPVEPVLNPISARILLVEDNAINQTVAKGILEEFDLQCDVAGNGAEALRALKQQPESDPYDILLMDCQMPEMDGYEASIRIRNGEAGQRYQQVPIVAMTANAMKGDREYCLKVGMSDYIAKPIDPGALETALRKWSCSGSQISATAERIKSPTDFGEPEQQSWNTNAALSRVRNKPERLQVLIDMFLSDMPQRLNEISRLLNSEDLTLLEKVAHTCKGVSGNLGADILMSHASDLEQACKNHDLELAKKYQKLFAEEHSKVVSLFNEYLSTLES